MKRYGDPTFSSGKSKVKDENVQSLVKEIRDLLADLEKDYGFLLGEENLVFPYSTDPETNGYRTLINNAVFVLTPVELKRLIAATPDLTWVEEPWDEEDEEPTAESVVEALLEDKDDLKLSDFKKFFVGTEDPDEEGYSVKDNPKKVRVYAFPSDRVMDDFLEYAGGMPHPFGGKRVIIAVEKGMKF